MRTRTFALALLATLAPLAAWAADDPFAALGTDEHTTKTRQALIRPIGEAPSNERVSHAADVKKDYPALRRIRTVKTGYASALTGDGKPVMLEKQLFNDGWSVSDATSLWIFADMFRERHKLSGQAILGDGTGKGLGVLSNSGKSVRFHIKPPSGPARNYLMTWSGSEITFRRDPAAARAPRAPKR